ncbi:hypothetical protein [Microbacterium sp.]|uniref:hypothetical protein n=1 Tax=Microbacterium sp. TaxID=51671 RepID=UPI0039E528F6
MPDEAQRVVRVPGSRRARLTAVPGTDPQPETRSADQEADAAPSASGAKGRSAAKGPNDDRLRQDVPPHY